MMILTSLNKVIWKNIITYTKENLKSQIPEPNKNKYTVCIIGILCNAFQIGIHLKYWTLKKSERGHIASHFAFMAYRNKTLVFGIYHLLAFFLTAL